jgi:hypothetical protein
MATLDEIQARLARLREIRSSGIRSTEFPETGRLEFRTDAELASAIADLERQIARLGSAPVRMVRFSTSKGV